MGKRKHLDKIEDLFKRSVVLDFKSIQRIIGVNGKNYAKLLINNLLKKGKINRLAKGCYTSHNEISLTVFCFKPSYIGLQSALSYHKLWDQATIPIILTTRKVRTGIRKVLGGNVYIRRLNKKKFFGFEYSKEGEYYLPYSDIEKTFIDMFLYRQKMSKETSLEIKKRIDRRKLKNYIKAYPKRFQKIVLKKLE